MHSTGLLLTSQQGNFTMLYFNFVPHTTVVDRHLRDTVSKVEIQYWIVFLFKIINKKI